MSHALRNGRVDSVLADVTFDSEVVGIGTLVLLQGAALHFVLVGRIPRPQDDLAAAAHSLRVGRHHADGTEIVQHVLGGNRLGTDAGLGKGDILGNVLGQVVAHHQHVQVLVQGVARVRPRGVGRRRQHVWMLDNTDDVRGMAATGTFGVVCVDDTVLDRPNGGFDVSRLIEGIRVNEALHIEFVTDGQARVNGCGRASPVLMKLQTTGTRDDLLTERLRCAIIALAGDANVNGKLVAGYQHVPSIVRSRSASRCTCTGASKWLAASLDGYYI